MSVPVEFAVCRNDGTWESETHKLPDKIFQSDSDTWEAKCINWANKHLPEQYPSAVCFALYCIHIDDEDEEN